MTSKDRILDTPVPAAAMWGRYTNKREAMLEARARGGHVHREEREVGPGWVYFVCTDAGCMEEG